jgi:hypothetical protein
MATATHQACYGYYDADELRDSTLIGAAWGGVSGAFVWGTLNPSSVTSWVKSKWNSITTKTPQKNPGVPFDPEKCYSSPFKIQE